MQLSSEIILAIKSLNGFGNKSVLKVILHFQGQEFTVSSLYSVVKDIKSSSVADITETDLDNLIIKQKKRIEFNSAQGIGVLSYIDEAFPDNLRNCIDEKGVLSPPLLLYYRGDLSILRRKSVAIIGTREPTEGGRKAGEWFGEKLSQLGYNIVSGLAIGCDSAGHIGALAGKGATTAFLANGLDWSSIYPKGNQSLAKQIVDNGGLLLSEYAPGEKVSPYNLVARDRLQAGLADATLVVQTGVKGGTMHAVNATLKAHKPLFVVDYKKDSDRLNEKSLGNIELLKAGAIALNSSNYDLELRKAFDTKVDNNFKETLF